MGCPFVSLPGSMSDKLLTLVLFFPGFLFSLSFHEAAHAWVASKLGDPTAKMLGRVSLNPVVHMDPIGTLVLPILGILSGGLIIGWGKPVPVDYRHFKNWKRDGLLVAGAGPLSNLILGVVFAIIIRVLLNVHPEWNSPEMGQKGFLLMTGLIQVFYLNLALAFFNLIPIHPLDGGKILYGILPQPLADRVDYFLLRYGFMVLLALFVTGIYRVLVGVPVSFVAHLLLS